MARELELERSLVGQCIPLWNNLRSKMKGSCSKYQVGEGVVEKVINRQFRKNYHPAWAAAFVIDSIYLVQDTSGKYLPPFKHLTPEQEKDEYVKVYYATLLEREMEAAKKQQEFSGTDTANGVSNTYPFQVGMKSKREDDEGAKDVDWEETHVFDKYRVPSNQL